MRQEIQKLEDTRTSHLRPVTFGDVSGRRVLRSKDAEKHFRRCWKRKNLRTGCTQKDKAEQRSHGRPLTLTGPWVLPRLSANFKTLQTSCGYVLLDEPSMRVASDF